MHNAQAVAVQEFHQAAAAPPAAIIIPKAEEAPAAVQPAPAQAAAEPEKLKLHRADLNMTLTFDNNERGRQLMTVYNPEADPAAKEAARYALYGPQRDQFETQADYAKAVVKWSPDQKAYFSIEL